jgi:LL-diaminopimelate aminotransferase
VGYAKTNSSIILYDAAYEAFIQEPDVPHSIFEIDGARECAIEFRSFSKNAGFTGTRCAFTVVPRELTASDGDGNEHALHSLWARRVATKFNGTSYPIQRAATAVYTEAGQAQVNDLINHYMGNAKILCEAARSAGLEVFGGTNAPYIWVKTPNGASSWDIFDKVLNEASVVITPGAGFGNAGEGYFRISAFNSRENAEEVANRIQAMRW